MRNSKCVYPVWKIVIFVKNKILANSVPKIHFILNKSASIVKIFQDLTMYNLKIKYIFFK